jgi:rod shape-determining protein MreC
MPVVNQAGLIGKITQVNATTSKVMLITDPRYSIPVEILGGTGDLDNGDEPSDTTPSGLSDEEIEEIVDQSSAEGEAAEAAAEAAETASTDPDPGDETATSGDEGPTPADVFENDVPLPQAGDPNEATTTTTLPLPEAVPAGVDDIPLTTDAAGNPVEIPETTTTTTVLLGPDQLEKEFGVLYGNGQGRPPQIKFLQDIPSLAVLQVGDLIETAGGSQSLAPANIPVGRVINRADRPGVAGPLLEIELNADLEKLNFVRVVLYQPLTEVGE